MQSDRVPLQTRNGWKQDKERVREKKKIKHQPQFSFKLLRKEPHDVDLRGWTESASVANWRGKKTHTRRVFISAQIKGTWKKGEVTTALSRKLVPRRHLNLEKYNWKRSDKHLPIWVCDVLSGIRKETAWTLITGVIVRITVMTRHGKTSSGAERRV